MNTIFDETIAIDYTKSAFSVSADNLLLKVMGGVVLMMLMVGWVVWFFFAHLTFYETTEAVMQPGGVVEAEFSSKSLARIKYEQSAFFQTQDSGGQPVSVPLRIVDIENKSGEVLFWPRDHENIQPNKRTIQGQVRVAVEHVTPATLVLRSSGLLSSSSVSSE